jgi:hypothetical protein
MYLYHLISIDLQSSRSFILHTAKLTLWLNNLPNQHLRPRQQSTVGGSKYYHSSQSSRAVPCCTQYRAIGSIPFPKTPSSRISWYPYIPIPSFSSVQVPEDRTNTVFSKEKRLAYDCSVISSACKTNNCKSAFCAFRLSS